MLYVPDLKGQFFCYVKPNPHGFLGELRDMVRRDMTVREAVEFHIQNWNFDENFNAIKMHDIAHIPFAIGTIYLPELEKYRIQANPEDSMLKARGYNGFMEGEFIAIAIQHVIESILKGEGTDDVAPFLRQGVKDAKLYYRHILDQNDVYFWVRASESKTPKSLFEAKFERQFELEPPRVPISSPTFDEPNSHGEALIKYQEPSEEELKTIAIKMDRLFKFIEESFKENNITKTYQAVEFLYNLKIRDLHTLIGGEEAAQAYFRSCGINTPQTHLTPKAA